MTIYAYTLDTAHDIQTRFQEFGRDYFPLPVYQYIFDAEEELAESTGEARCLDVIGWCCDISVTDLEDENQVLRERGFDEDDLYTLEDLASELEDKTTVLYVDDYSGAVYHLAY